MPDLHIELHRANRWLVVQPCGDLTMAVSPTLFNKVQIALQELGLMNVLFDMSKLQIIDSSGLGTMIAIRRQLAVGGGRVCVAECNRLLSTLLKTTHLDQDFPQFASVEEALLYADDSAPVNAA
jgi:anti-anti-sigma factor